MPHNHENAVTVDKTNDLILLVNYRETVKFILYQMVVHGLDTRLEFQVFDWLGHDLLSCYKLIAHWNVFI